VSKVAILMATRALHPDHASALWSLRHRRLVSDHLHALQGHISVRVAIGASGMEQHPAGFEEQHARTLLLVRDDREIGWSA
jgi:hypothetical protein